MKKNILVACLPDPSGNPRPRRMIELCKKMGHSVEVVSLPLKAPMDIEAHYALNPLPQSIVKKLMRKAMRALMLLIPSDSLSNIINERSWGLTKIIEKLKNKHYDAIIVHDALLLPFVFKIKRHAKIIFDAREFYPREMENSFLWRLFESPKRTRLCRKLMPQCDQIMTVSKGIAERYEVEFNVKCEIVRSAPAYYRTGVKPMEKGIIRMVHHGVANRDRRLENMITSFSFLDERFTLDFYLTGDRAYKNELIKKASGQSRIRFLDPVLFEKILPMLQGYDIGLYLLEPTGFNTEYSLPNKFFEFVQARLMLAIGPSPEMASLINLYGCGIVTDDFEPETMAKALNNLKAEEILDKKHAAHRAAEDLCFEKEGLKIVSILSSVGIPNYSKNM